MTTREEREREGAWLDSLIRSALLGFRDGATSAEVARRIPEHCDGRETPTTSRVAARLAHFGDHEVERFFQDGKRAWRLTAQGRLKAEQEIYAVERIRRETECYLCSGEGALADGELCPACNNQARLEAADQAERERQEKARKVEAALATAAIGTLTLARDESVKARQTFKDKVRELSIAAALYRYGTIAIAGERIARHLAVVIVELEEVKRGTSETCTLDLLRAHLADTERQILDDADPVRDVPLYTEVARIQREALRDVRTALLDAILATESIRVLAT